MVSAIRKRNSQKKPSKIPADRDQQSGQVLLFCSYARQDIDILNAFTRAFQALNDTVNHNIFAFTDQAIGIGRNFDDAIRKKLQDTDYLLVFYTGALKPSHSYTGFEVGYFNATIDIENNSKSPKEIISFYLKDPPAPTSQIQGIDLTIGADDLNLSRNQYTAAIAEKATTEQGKADKLTQFFLKITELAIERNPLQDNDAIVQLDRYRIVQEKIIPALRGDLHDCLSSRVARSSIEQRFIRFELPKTGSMGNIITAIPDDTKLTEEGRAFELFGVSADSEGIFWKDFKQQLELRIMSTSPALYAIERALVTAISSDRSTDNDQIIKAPHDNNLYRVIVTEKKEYYDGRLIVHMWFIRFLNRDYYANRRMAILLSFILVAAKYRFLFLEKDSSLSVEKFRLEDNDEKFQQKVRDLLRETILIEEESHVFGLNTPEALILIVGTKADYEQVSKDLEGYAATREAMELAANAVLKTMHDVPEFQQARANWVAALDVFLKSSGGINSVYTVSALKNLQDYFLTVK
jgi:hypothetical protein